MSAWPGSTRLPPGRGRAVIALTLSKGGNPDIYTLRVGTSDFRQITNNRGIETDPSWSPPVARSPSPRIAQGPLRSG